MTNSQLIASEYLIVGGRRLLVGAAAVAVAAYAARSLYRAWQLPPGPWGLPILGRLPWIDINHFEESEEEMRQRYGDIYSYRAGQRLMIVVSNYELLNEMFKQEVFSGRQVPALATRLADGCGIVFVEGATWSEQRRLCLRVLRDFGFGRTESIQHISNEVDNVLQVVKNDPINQDVHQLFSAMSNSVIASLVFGRRYANEDPRYDEFIANVNKIFTLGLSSTLSFLFPTFSFFLESLADVSDVVNCINAVQRFIEEEIAERESQLTSPDDERLCLCDAYIQERRKAEANGDFDTFKPYHLVRVALEMFIAGTDTTSRSMQWLLLHMAVYPEVQAGVQREIDEAVGRERRPQTSDKTRLHYTQAVIDESMRFASLSFNGVSHRAMKDTTFRGYRIPADAAIVPFVFGVHRDPSVWRRPLEFFPGHFLDSNGCYASSKHLIPFLIGKRSCPGESLAKLEIFLAFVGVMQHWSVQLRSEDQARVAELLRGFTQTGRNPVNHRLNFVQRQR